MKKYLLGVDNGGTATKAAIFDLSGKEIAVCSSPTPVITPTPGLAERDMTGLWHITASVINNAIQKADINSSEIAAIGCTGHGKGLYLTDKNGNPCYNAIASTDSRAAEVVKLWQENGTAKKAAEKTLQNVLACQPAALLYWLKQNSPETYKNINHVFEAKDYIRFMLTGEAFAEMTDYSGTSLMNLCAKSFDKELLKLFGIEEIFGCLPPLKLSYELCGSVTEEAAELTGLTKGTPVCGGMFDIDACAIAMDVSDEEKLCAITGTWSINEYLSRTPVLPNGSTLNSVFCIPEYYLIEESSPTSAGNLEWIAEMFLGKESEKLKESGLSIYKYMDETVKSTAPEESDIIFLPFLYGSNVKGIENAAFLGLSSAHSKKHIIRAAFEGVVFSHVYHIKKLLKNRSKPSAIRLSGGAAKSRVWAQMFADTLQIPFETVNVKELGALGCAMAAAVTAGIYSDYKSAAKSMTGETEVILPDKEKGEIYSRKFNRYCEILNKLAIK